VQIFIFLNIDACKFVFTHGVVHRTYLILILIFGSRLNKGCLLSQVCNQMLRRSCIRGF